MAEAPSLIIQELTGSGRKVELKGRALPYRQRGSGMPFGQELRTKKTDYPGNPVSTQQALGPTYPNTEIAGMWKDRFLGPDVKVSGDPLFPAEPLAEDLILLMYDIQRSGNALRVSWGFEVRAGLMIRFIPDYERLEDVGWEMEFEWFNRDDEEAPRGAEEPDPFGSLLSSLLSFLNQLANLPFPGPIADFAARLTSVINSITDAITGVFDTIRNLNNLVALPGQLLNQLLNAINSIVELLLDERSRLSEEPTSSQVDEATQAEVADLLLFEIWKRDMSASFTELASVMLQVGETFRQRARPRATQFVTTPAQTTLYQLSVAFYGTPDFASFLLRANRSRANSPDEPGLRDGNVAAGTVIAIPPRPINDPGVDCT